MKQNKKGFALLIPIGILAIGIIFMVFVVNSSAGGFVGLNFKTVLFVGIFMAIGVFSGFKLFGWWGAIIGIIIGFFIAFFIASLIPSGNIRRFLLGVS